MKFKFKNKIIEIKEVKECRGISKIIGLMFSSQKNASARVFNFRNPVKMSIHSLFCPEFLAVWLRKGRVIGYEFIQKIRLSAKPSSEFDCLLEIPLNGRYKNVIRYFK